MALLNPADCDLLVLIEHLAHWQMNAISRTSEPLIDINQKLTAGRIGYCAEIIALQKFPGYYLGAMDIFSSQFNGIRGEVIRRPNPTT